MIQHKTHHWLWIIWGVWGSALVIWLLPLSLVYRALLFVFIMLLPILTLLIIAGVRKYRRIPMALFKSKSRELVNENGHETEATAFNPEAVKAATEPSIVSKAKSSKVTFIAQQTRLVGDIHLAGDIHIDGQLEGTIKTDGTITVMLNGQVQGELMASAIIINGQVTGLCDAPNIEILEKGQVFGTLRSNALSVSKGGLFIGTSENREEAIPLQTHSGRKSTSAKRENLSSQTESSAQQSVSDMTG